jgi:hypothetical protein
MVRRQAILAANKEAKKPAQRIPAFISSMRDKFNAAKSA